MTTPQLIGLARIVVPMLQAWHTGIGQQVAILSAIENERRALRDVARRIVDDISASKATR